MTREIDRRTFLSMTGLAATSGVVGLTFGCSRNPGATSSAPPVASAPPAGQAPPRVDAPANVLDPVEVSGEEAVPIMGRLPGARRMYVLPSEAGEHHLVGAFAMTRAARPVDTANVYELLMFSGRTGASMPRHLHRSSHTALLVLGGDVELELDGRTWRMLRGDFANIPPGTPHAWTMRSDRAKLALYSMNDRAGAAFVAMGAPQGSAAPPDGAPATVADDKLADAAYSGDFMRVPSAAAGEPVRVANKLLPSAPGPYVILDGGGERYGGNTFLARNANTTGNFLFIITEGGPGPGVPAHFHARHFENFLGLDGETLGWAYGKAVPLKAGDYFQAPPRNLHGFKLTQQYNRFAAFLTPGIFEQFFVNGGGAPPGARGGPPAAGGPPGAGGPPPGAGAGRGGPPPGVDIFKMLQMSGRGPDGYPLDVHGHKLPLPPQDAVWLQGADATDVIRQREAIRMHAQMLNGTMPMSHGLTPELERALSFKPRAEDFI
jgi:quercetin 2,3-dioxygenase